MCGINQLLRFGFIHFWQMNVQGSFDTKAIRDRTDTDFTFNSRLFRHRDFVTAGDEFHCAQEAG